jgi:hypothetical protein
MVTRRGISGVLGICDADYDRIMGVPEVDNVLNVDYHDTEVMICCSSSFVHAYREIYERDGDDREIEHTRLRLIGHAGKVGRVRLWSLQNGGKLGFKNLNAGTHLLPDGSFDFREYAAEVTKDRGVSISAVVALSVASIGLDDADIACGHDVSSLLDADAAARRGSGLYGRELIEKMLRLSFDQLAFRSTNIYASIKIWEEKNGLTLILDA